MAAFARAWTQWTGGRAIGVTLSTNAARVMATEGITQAVNVAQFLGRLEDGGSRGAMRLTAQDVVVVDEASQVSTADLAAILAAVRAAGARAILTGDTAQLGAVEAGGMMRLLAADLGHWELAEVRRFDAAWEADASLQLRQGDRAALAPMTPTAASAAPTGPRQCGTRWPCSPKYACPQRARSSSNRGNSRSLMARPTRYPSWMDQLTVSTTF